MDKHHDLKSFVKKYIDTYKTKAKKTRKLGS